MLESRTININAANGVNKQGLPACTDERLAAGVMKHNNVYLRHPPEGALGYMLEQLNSNHANSCCDPVADRNFTDMAAVFDMTLRIYTTFSHHSMFKRWSCALSLVPAIPICHISQTT